MHASRNSHTATLLPNGNVLVAGGFSGGTLSSVEVYDRLTGTWTTTSALTANCFHHTATLLANGRVLAAGSWVRTRLLNSPRYAGGSTLLPDGNVLYVGGFSSNFLNEAEVYDSVLGKWTLVEEMKNAGDVLTATLLFNGKVLVVGGYDGFEFVADSELYDPVTARWTTSGALNAPRLSHTATLLLDGKVLVAGGEGTLVRATNSAELYDPIGARGPPPTHCPSRFPVTRPLYSRTARCWSPAAMAPTELLPGRKYSIRRADPTENGRRLPR